MRTGTKDISLALAVLGLVVGAAGHSRAEVITILQGSSVSDDGEAIYAWTNIQPAGTGVFNTFLRSHAVGGDNIETGYNTDGAVQFDTMDDPHTHSLLLSQVPILTIDNVEYREFVLDINDPLGREKNLISLGKLQIYTTSNPGITGFNESALPGNGFGSASATLVYSLDKVGDNDRVELDSGINRGGSGIADMFLYVRNDLFSAAGPNSYVVLYNEFGVPHAAEGGFEEWGVRAAAVPEASTLVSAGLIGLMGLGYTWRRRKADPAV